MIKFKKIDKKGEFLLLIDGVVFEDITVKESYASGMISITTQNFKETKKILDYKWNEFPRLREIDLKLKKIGQFKVRLMADVERTSSKHLLATFAFEAAFKEWKGNYSFTEYTKEYKKNWNRLETLGGELQFYEEDVVQYEINFQILLDDKKIKEILAPYQNLLARIHQNVIEKLSLRDNQNILSATFDFPEEIKFSCEQYLLYFVQFLRDSGINATSSLNEKAGKVLFSVTPADDVEALDKIREALAIYLNLPSSPIEYNDSFAAMRLQQQIENLQHSQRMTVRELQFNEKLLIAQSETIREKNLTISQQQSVIEQKDKIIEKISSKSIMIDSAENKEELEEIFDGLKIGESKFLKEQLGIHLNPAKVIKTAVKNTFGKNEKISILDSDEETDKK